MKIFLGFCTGVAASMILLVSIALTQRGNGSSGRLLEVLGFVQRQTETFDLGSNQFVVAKRVDGFLYTIGLVDRETVYLSVEPYGNGRLIRLVSNGDACLLVNQDTENGGFSVVRRIGIDQEGFTELFYDDQGEVELEQRIQIPEGKVTEILR